MISKFTEYIALMYTQWLRPAGVQSAGAGHSQEFGLAVESQPQLVLAGTGYIHGPFRGHHCSLVTLYLKHWALSYIVAQDTRNLTLMII